MTTRRIHWAALAAGLLLAGASARADRLELAWQIAPGDPDGIVTTDNTQRGMAYNPVSKRVLVVNRAGGNKIMVLNAETGAFLHNLQYDAFLIFGGTFAVNMIGVADDGMVYVGNLALLPGNPTFKLYRWADDGPDTYPELVYDGDPMEGASNQRWGDSLAVRGAGLDTQIVVPARANDRVAILTTADGFTFTAKVIPGAANGAGSLGVAFGEGNTLWTKLNGQPLRHVSFDLAAGTATLLHSFGTPGVPGGISPLGVSGKYFAGVFIDSSTTAALGVDSLRLFDISNLSAPPVVIDQKDFPANNPNGNFVGAVDFGDGVVFALDTNCGLVAYRVVQTVDPVEILTQPANLTVLEGSTATFSVGAKGTLPIEYQWLHNGAPIANAKSSTLTLPGVTPDQAGEYSVMVKNQVNELESAKATLTVVPMVKSDALTLKWKLAPGDKPWLTTDDRHRGMAYNPANGHVLVLSRTGGEGIYVLDGQTGQQLNTLTIDTSVITGGTYILNMIAVADDGAVYAGNLSTAATPNFRLYRWDNDQAGTVPVRVFDADPANGLDAQRWGDAMTVRGQGANTQILISSRFGKSVAILTTTDGATFTSTLIPVDAAAAGQFGLGVAFGDGDTFYGKQTGTSLMHVGFDLAAGTGTVLNDYACGTMVPCTLCAVAYDPKNKFLAGFALETADSVRLYDLADPATPVLIDQGFCAADNANINGTGAAVFGGDMLYVLDTNNGVVAFAVKKPSQPATLTDVKVNGTNLEFTVQGAAGVGYDVVGSNDFTAWTTVAGVSGTGPSFVASVPMSGHPYRFFRAVQRP